MRLLDIGNERRLRRSIEKVDAFAYEVIQRRREEMRVKQASAAARSDILTAFMRAKDEEGGEKYSDEFLKDVCVNFILAGRDTSSVALAWFFWLLQRNAEVEEKILQEVKGILKDRGAAERGNMAAAMWYSGQRR
ncbi:hypothetical protein HPP92_022479 [Vanilla planifolia]|uniref:noroxomaritidine synthase n=1 Tax=Vanilla planifolia TaxID=51239 RepID=A0A835PTL3_VANPL|nr:hypothetical protein HPP92_022479 [Vanilla planifolia]